jgi:hypothetical protein
MPATAKAALFFGPGKPFADGSGNRLSLFIHRVYDAAL